MKYLARHQISLILLIVIFFLIGCNVKYVCLNMPKNNITTYEYPINIVDLRKLIIDNFNLFKNELQCSEFYGKLYEKDTIVNKTILRKVFAEDKNKYDLVFDGYAGHSQLYITTQGEKISYFASFHIHFEVINDNKTKTEIKTLNPRIDVPTNFFITHAPGFYKMYNVEPSTIEEYKILLTIGKLLGIENNMPPIILPESQIQ